MDRENSTEISSTKDVLRDTFEKYNEFCRSVNEGDILYNIDSTNCWGDYLLVAAKAPIKVRNAKSWFILLLGLDLKDDKLITTSVRINLTPDEMQSTYYLKYVGYCKYSLTPTIYNSTIVEALKNTYKNIDLWKYSKKLHLRKPKKRKYGRDGKPIINNNNNS